MKKVLKIILIVIVCIFALGMLAFILTGSAANSDEYKLGNDQIKSIKAVVDKRQVTATSIKTENGLTTKSITYKSDDVQGDLLKYVQYLRGEGGFTLTKDMNLSEIPSTVELGKESNDSGKIIMMTIDYNSFEYTITIQKGKGQLTIY